MYNLIFISDYNKYYLFIMYKYPIDNYNKYDLFVILLLPYQ